MTQYKIYVLSFFLASINNKRSLFVIEGDEKEEKDNPA
jgi:hypothetical protein